MLNYKIIRDTPEDINIKINIIDDFNIINNYNKLELSEVVTNENIDNENNIFKNISEYTLNFNFFNGLTYKNSFEHNGFTLQEIQSKSKLFRYSYFILAIYDTFVKSKQKLLHVGYIPLYQLNNLTTSSINIKDDYEFNRYYINKSYGINKNFYCRFYFFNAKNGLISSFINQNGNKSNEERLYNGMFFNDKLNSWFLEKNSNLNQINNVEFNNKLNNDIEKSKIILPELKGDKIFKIDGEYYDII